MNFIENPGENKKIGIIGVPMGFGAGQIGSELGVTALRLSKFRGDYLTNHIRQMGYTVEDFGDAEIINPDKTVATSLHPRYLPEMIESSKNIASSVKSLLQKGNLPLILGGDHSMAIGTFSGVSSYFHDRNEEIGLIWFDAHADINRPETSPSGNIHGMPLAVLLGHGNGELVNLENFAPKLNPKYFAHIGARDVDDGEKRFINELGMRDNFFTMSDIDRRGMLDCVEDAWEIVSAAPGGYAVTFDIDMIDPRFAPGSGTLVRGGTTYREAHLALEILYERGGMRSFEMVEVNPMLDQRNITVELAGELILSALGKTIL